MLVSVFFFQAEDGIRDAQESRGLGDVYKRQAYTDPNSSPITPPPTIIKCLGISLRLRISVEVIIHFLSTEIPFKDAGLDPVSYTHLTLPTIYSV